MVPELVETVTSRDHLIGGTSEDRREAVTPDRHTALAGEDQTVTAFLVPLQVKGQSIGNHRRQRNHPIRGSTLHRTEAGLAARGSDQLTIDLHRPS